MTVPSRNYDSEKKAESAMRRYAQIFALVAAALCLQSASAPNLNAAEEAKKATFNFNSILPLEKEFEDKDKVEFIGVTDKKLQAELKSLRKEYGYNSFESLRSASMTALKDKTIEYRLVDKMKLHCRITLKRIRTWTDDHDRKHIYVSFTAEIVERTKGPRGKVIDKTVFKIDTRRESGRYLILVFPEFFPKTDDEPARDLVLAIQALA